jgi:hypothetical protein
MGVGATRVTVGLAALSDASVAATVAEGVNAEVGDASMAGVAGATTRWTV